MSVNAGPPASVLVGESTVAAPGTGLFTVKLLAVEVPPPGAGLVTVTGTTAPVAMSAAGIFTVISAEAIEVGISPTSAPKLTVAPAAKPEPLIVSRKVAPPARVLFGTSELIAGAGFVPVPVSATFCGEFGASSLMARVAERAPVALGVNVTLNVQFAPAANTPAPVGQGFTAPPATAKSPGFVLAGEIAVEVKFSVSEPELVTVRVVAALVVVMS